MEKSKTSKQALSLAAVNGFLAVALGAFGAHGLEQKISAEMLAVFNTGIQYHMFHVAALIGVALAAQINTGSRRLAWSIRAFMAGIVLFSGSLYVLAITGITALGMITPLGGVAFLAGWVLLFVEAIAEKKA